jgi:phosphoribosylaminoimidazolecarboxamide formyltransferase/IMP cyclohydrolase
MNRAAAPGYDRADPRPTPHRSRPMPSSLPIRRALLSVSDKTDLIPFARALAERGIELVSTGGTAKVIAATGLPVVGVDSLTGFPEMMGGRVKTLHPAVHGAILARRDDAEHLAAMEQHGIGAIDLVCVNLYPFERTLSEDLSRDEAIELIDIGGPSMIRSAAKNHEFVTVVTSPTQYDRVANELRQHDGATTLELRRDLAAAAFSRTAEYDATISAWMCGREASFFPPMLRQSLTKREQLRYGENPHQQAAVYADPAQRGANVVTAPLLHGKPLSYNNLNDAAAALELVRDLRQLFPARAAAAIIKHTNPCGAAMGDSARAAFDGAYAGDPLAAYGGILAINVPIDEPCARRLCEGERFFEVIVAPSFDDRAVALLGERWKMVRLLAVGDIAASSGLSSVELRSIPGGMLLQHRDLALPDPSKWTHAAGPGLESRARDTACLAVVACKHLKSNAVAIAADGAILGAGAGQMDRVTASRLAVERAGGRVRAAGGAVAASDGFFPFDDGPRLLIEAGVKVIVQPGGSKRDEDTVRLCAEREVTLMLTGVRHFKH